MCVVSSSSIPYFLVVVDEKLYGAICFAFWAFCLEAFVFHLVVFTSIKSKLGSTGHFDLIKTIKDLLWSVMKNPCWQIRKNRLGKRENVLLRVIN